MNYFASSENMLGFVLYFWNDLLVFRKTHFDIRVIKYMLVLIVTKFVTQVRMLARAAIPKGTSLKSRKKQTRGFRANLKDETLIVAICGSLDGYIFISLLAGRFCYL